MSPTFYHILHVISVLVLTGFTFYAFAAPAETRKRVLMITGIASLVALVGGFGLVGNPMKGLPGWVFVKIACWLVLSALAGLGYRKRGAEVVLSLVAMLVIVVAIVTVYMQQK